MTYSNFLFPKIKTIVTKLFGSVGFMAYQPLQIIQCQILFLRGSLNSFQAFFFRMGTFIDSTHMKL